MTKTLKNIPVLLANGETTEAIDQLLSALALSESELVAFGLAALPGESLHLLMDILERKI